MERNIKKQTKSLYSLLIFIAGNIALIVFFSSGLIEPIKDSLFPDITEIVALGVLFFEFLSIHSSALMPAKKNKLPLLALSSFYIIFAFSFGAVFFKSIYVPLFFVISLISKFFGSKSHERNNAIPFGIGFLIISIVSVMVGGSVLDIIYPINVSFESGIYVVGMLYFILSTIFEVSQFIKKSK